MNAFARDEYLAMLGHSRDSLAATVRNRHNPDCACGQDEALTEPINPKDAE